jgi:MoaA/NifB/PqqE/SkfB family radical SAM enzyme
MSIGQLLWNLNKKRLAQKAGHKETKSSYFISGNLALICTTKCNFSCKHCLRDLNKEKDLPLEIAEKVLLGAKKYNFKRVAITGGEPFVYPHIKQLIDSVIANGYACAVVTNGYNFKNYAEFLKERRQHLSYIAFSLESTDKNEHNGIRREGSFDVLMENFDTCRKYRIPFRIITAVSQVNFEKLFDLALLAKKKGAHAFVATTVLPCPRSEENSLVLEPEKRQLVFEYLKELQKMIKLPIHISADLRGNSNVRICGPMNLNELTIDADGNLVQCCELANYGQEEIYQKTTISSLRDKSFDDAFKDFMSHMDKLCGQRIEDYKTQADTQGIDFNSCFYCVHKIWTP